MAWRLFIVLFFSFTHSIVTNATTNTFHHDFKSKEWFSTIDEKSILIGSGKLYFFGIELYEAAFISSSETNGENLFDNSFALSIKYSKNFSKKGVADRSSKEIFKLNICNENELREWHIWMLENLPEIKKNDVLTAIYLPETGMKLYHNDILIAVNDDTSFAKAFFSIWLSQDTSEPGLREKLIGIKK